MGTLLDEYHKSRADYQQKVEDGKKCSTFSELDDFLALLRQQDFEVTVDQTVHTDEEFGSDAPRVFTNLKIKKGFHWINFLEKPGCDGYSETRSSRWRLAYPGKGLTKVRHPTVNVPTIEDIVRQVACWQEEHKDHFLKEDLMADRERAERVWASQPFLKRLFVSRPSVS